MHPTLSYYGDLAFDPLAPRDVGIVLENARALQRAAEAGELRALLRGRKLGLLCEAEAAGDDEAVMFCSAAAELGAHVAHIRPSLTEMSPPQEVRRTSRMLGLLYDAVGARACPQRLCTKWVLTRVSRSSTVLHRRRIRLPDLPN